MSVLTITPYIEAMFLDDAFSEGRGRAPHPKTHQPDVRPGQGGGDVLECCDIHFSGKHPE